MEKDDIILLLLEAHKSPIVGTTRIQKLLFLIEKEKEIIPIDKSFNFEPYKYGPASKDLYDDLDFLVNLGYITKSDNKESLKDLNLDQIENYSADIFLYNNFTQDASTNCPPYEVKEINDSVIYKITDEGIRYLSENKLLESKDFIKIKDIINKYGNYSLTSLLQYIYSRYPGFTEESEIKDDIL
jgi:uncharacterized protein